LATVTHPPAPYTLSLHDALPISGDTGEPVERGRSASPLPRPLKSGPGTRLRGVERISCPLKRSAGRRRGVPSWPPGGSSAPIRRSEEHTSELQSRFDLVCRLLLE